MRNPLTEAKIAVHEHKMRMALERYRGSYCAGLNELAFIFNARDAEFLRAREECDDPGELETYYDEFMLSVLRKGTAYMLLPHVRDEFKPFVRYLANRKVGALPRVVIAKKRVTEREKRLA